MAQVRGGFPCCPCLPVCRAGGLRRARCHEAWAGVVLLGARRPHTKQNAVMRPWCGEGRAFPARLSVEL
eukprot:12289001-Prorocentrum_lima.AAC.1